MFKDNKYTKTYYAIINRSKLRNLTEYYENHHIIPRCLGGGNEKSNIARLTAREHFLVHWILTKMSDFNGLKFAFQMMLVINDKQNRDYRVTSKIFEVIKKMNSVASSIRSKGKQKHNVGKKKYHDPLTNVDFFLFPENLTDGLVKGYSPKTKAAMVGKNVGKKYYYHSVTNDVINLPDYISPPDGYIAGNPKSNTGYTCIGKKSFHDPVNGKTVKCFECPTGYVNGSGKEWITNGVDNALVSVIDLKLIDDWRLGKTTIRKPRISLNRSINTPLGIFDHIITFCEKYSCCRSLFTDLDGKLRRSIKTEKLVLELTLVNYDFKKTKRENGFKFI